MGLIDFDDLTVVAISKAALELLGLPVTEVVGRPVTDLLQSGGLADHLAAIEAMRIGIIDFYRGHPHVGLTEESGSPATTWVRAVQFGDRRVAFVEVVDGSQTGQSPLAEYLGREPLEMAVGEMDDAWIVTSVSNNIESVLGVRPEEVVGRPLLGGIEQRNVRTLLIADQRTDTESSVALQIRLNDRTGTSKPFRCVLTSLAGSADRLFILIAEPETPANEDPDRASQMERHLWRIAAEVEASGILQQIGKIPNTGCFPQIEALTVRQWEVLSRLIGGDRVPTIAAALFVSQSTVRNHLSAIFERFGVHSQAELLALLGKRDGSPI
jgi:DNA-binding CsgD family transcriptional regulator/PAS domain-containing protein